MKDGQVPQKKNSYFLIQQIKEGKRAPETLKKRERQDCVELLELDGYSPNELALFFDVTPKTISRDLNQIFERNDVSRDPKFVDRIVGQFTRDQDNHKNFHMRLARNKDKTIPAAVKLLAEHYAEQVEINKIKVLLLLGRLPYQPQRAVIQHKEVPSMPPAVNILPVSVKSKKEEDGKSN